MTNKKTMVAWSIMMLLAIAISFIAPTPYFITAPAAWPEIFRKSDATYPIALMIHAFCGALALITGPFQFLPQIRQRNITIHRWLGRVYLGVGVLLGGLSGLYVAQFSFAGLSATLGFSMLSALWLFTGGMAYWRIRHGQVKLHQEWLIRNYALTFAGVTLRLWIPLGMVWLSPELDTRFHGDNEAWFKEIYLAVPWLSWVPNLLGAEVLINHWRTWRESNGS